MREKAIAIIPARGGSKRILRKNIRDFLGKPIITYPIEVAIESELFDEIMVSTDDKEIAAIAKSSGATVPFFRSATNSDDQANTTEVITEVLSEYQKFGKTFSLICCLYSTAVFVTKELIIQAQQILLDTHTSGVVTVVPYSHPIERALSVVNNHLIFHNPDLKGIRTQDLAPSYYDAAQLYFLKTEAFMNEKSMFLHDCAPIIMSPSTVQDIDSFDDWHLAKLKYKYQSEKSK
jgi:N-acylneuraminate cytidylyltransferase